MLENGFVYATVVFSIVTVLVGSVLWFVIQLTNKEGKRPGDH
jgi:hypothetical protein